MTKIHFKFLNFFCVISLLFSLACKKDNDDDIIADIPDFFVTSIIDEINADTIKSYVQWMQNYNSRFFLKNNRKQIANDIKDKFIQLGYADTRLDSFYLSADWNNTTYNTWQYNVIARLEGSSEPDNVYVTGAHYDCIVDEGDPFISAPGANDNASGIAGMIEIARVFKKKNFIPKHTIEFVAFAAEEYDLNGSKDYAENASSNNINIIMMLNNDMISYEPRSDPSEWTLNVMDYNNSSELRTKFVKCGKTYTCLQFIHDNEYNDVGDSFSFYENGYESVFIINEATEAYYHTINDVVGHYNFNYCSEVISITGALLIQENK
ncbi:MAG: M20/M25/M40 family metallo-hydrolase [Bacteroidales bacterium]|nr:M20/M25/M40 family metallo-hydrolase [Bacteroidales bacterium]